MPYARNADLPAQVRNPLPNPAQTLFRTVANAQLNAGKSDEIAFRSAWSAVGRQYKKPPVEGAKWVHKRNGTLYAKRIVENMADIDKWAKEQGFNTTQKSNMHATVAFSKTLVDWPEPDDDTIIVRSVSKRSVEMLGDGGAVVLKFQSPSLTRRWQSLCDDHGCSWDHDGFQPHITITWDIGDVDLEKVVPYTGDIVLGPEVFEPINEDWRDTITEKVHAPVPIIKLDKKLGLVFGWAIVSKVGGQDYYDLQGDHIPEDTMLTAAADFMSGDRDLKLMHKGKSVGQVVFAWPLTTETAKAMGLRSNVTGLMIAAKPTKKMITDIEAGKLTGFSIGGLRGEDEEIDE